ncbi:hypothetical protein PRIC2_004290 [Phytophthora ramorum]
MGKERFIPSPFGELILSDTDKVALKDFAYSFFEAQVAKYEDFITDEGFRVNERDWKYMKSKEGSRVYVERNPMVRESQMGSKATDYPALLLTGTSWGTIEDWDMIKALVVPSMATGYLTVLKYAHCSEMKKITWLLRKRHAALKEFGRTQQPPVCVTCTASISRIRSDVRKSQGHSCKLCGGYLCRSCRVPRRVAIVGIAGFLDQHKVTFCGRCLQQVRQMSPLEIAKEYATGLGKQTISFASIDSSLSSSMSD